MSKRLTIYGVLILLTLLSWAILQLNKPEQVVKKLKATHNPDFFSVGYSKIELDEQGHYKNKLVASKLTHFPDDETFQLENPEMIAFKSDQSSWNLQAKKGWLSTNNDNLLLRGDVVVIRSKSEDQRAIRLDTSSLRIKLKEEYAETDDKVFLSTAQDVTEGVGMQINFAKPSYLKLLTKVKGRYVLN
jgi:lipopolysaccharide export system protein LptC